MCKSFVRWDVNNIIIHSKYFPVSDWLKPLAEFTITSFCSPIFGENLRHIESMTSKVQRAENYWTDDVKMTSKGQPAADYWTVDGENLGTRLCYIWWAEKQRTKWRNSFKNEEIFWMSNKAIIEFGFRRIWRILQISEGLCGWHPPWSAEFFISYSAPFNDS